jgi:hypothetical protein
MCLPVLLIQKRINAGSGRKIPIPVNKCSQGIYIALGIMLEKNYPTASKIRKMSSSMDLYGSEHVR